MENLSRFWASIALKPVTSELILHLSDPAPLISGSLPFDRENPNIFCKWLIRLFYENLRSSICGLTFLIF